MAAIAALCTAAEKNSSPCRALRSRGGVLGDNGDGTKAKPPQLPGQKKLAKALLHKQPELFLMQPLAPQEQPSPPTKPPSLPPMPPPPPVLPPRRSTLCDWVQAESATFHYWLHCHARSMDARDLSITFVNMHGRKKEGTRSMSPKFAASIIQTTSKLMSQRRRLVLHQQRMRKGVQIAHHEHLFRTQVQLNQPSPALEDKTVQQVVVQHLQL